MLNPANVDKHMKRRIVAIALAGLASVASTGNSNADPETSEGACHKHTPGGDSFMWSRKRFDGTIHIYNLDIAACRT